GSSPCLEETPGRRSPLIPHGPLRNHGGIVTRGDRARNDGASCIPVAGRRVSRAEQHMDESFETYRSYLFAIAYRMLGSAMDAEDMVQETYLRYQGTPLDTIRSPRAFLTTIITRLC